MSRIRVYIIGLCLLFPLYAGAIDMPCDDINHPQVCAFLNRYLEELLQWNNPNISLFRKMRDDKFIILDGSLEAINACTGTTAFSLIRYENKAYEAAWYNGADTLLHVAFPIQYELILGMPQIEIEQHLHEYIANASHHEATNFSNIRLDSIAPNIYRSAPKQHYQIPSLNNCKYFRKGNDGSLQLICDTTQVDYTVANLFQEGLGKEYIMQVSQSLYGFKHLDYTISLQQWLDYCAVERLMCYVAIEEEMNDAIQVLVVAENQDLAYNHLLSVLIPRKVLGDQTGTLLVKINAFIPTHNISNLYEQYTTKTKRQKEWIKN